MAKNKLITLRVAEQTKARLEQAANAEGKTVSTFILEKVLAQMDEKEIDHGNESLVTDINEFFETLFETAQQGGPKGYWKVGSEIAQQLESIWHRLGFDANSIADKFEAYDARSNKEAWDWFSRNVPTGWVERVPARRRLEFARGIRIIMKEHVDFQPLLCITLDSDKNSAFLTWNRDKSRFEGILNFSSGPINPTEIPHPVTFRFQTGAKDLGPLAEEPLFAIAQEGVEFTFIHHHKPSNAMNKTIAFEQCTLEQDLENEHLFIGKGMVTQETIENQ